MLERTNEARKRAGDASQKTSAIGSKTKVNGKYFVIDTHQDLGLRTANS